MSICKACKRAHSPMLRCEVAARLAANAKVRTQPPPKARKPPPRVRAKP